MYERDANHSTGEMKPVEYLILIGGHRADLYGVHVRGRVLEQAVVGIEELARQQVEELARRTAVVETLLALKTNKQLVLAQVVLAQLHEFGARVVQELVASHHDLRLLRPLTVAFRLEFAVEIAQLSLKTSMIVSTIISISIVIVVIATTAWIVCGT